MAGVNGEGWSCSALPKSHFTCFFSFPHGCSQHEVVEVSLSINVLKRGDQGTFKLLLTLTLTHTHVVDLLLISALPVPACG